MGTHYYLLLISVQSEVWIGTSHSGGGGLVLVQGLQKVLFFKRFVLFFYLFVLLLKNPKKIFPASRPHDRRSDDDAVRQPWTLGC